MVSISSVLTLYGHITYYKYTKLFNNYPSRPHGISPDTKPTRLEAEMAKIKQYSTRLSAINCFIIQQNVNEIHFTPRKSVVRQENKSFQTKRDDLRISPDI